MPERDEPSGGEGRPGVKDWSDQDLAFYLRRVGFALSDVAEAIETRRGRVVWLLAREGLRGLRRLRFRHALKSFRSIFRAGRERPESIDAIPQSLESRLSQLCKAYEKAAGPAGDAGIGADPDR